MLKVVLPPNEFWDSETETFITVESVEIELEHSLISLSKWESKFQKPFLSVEKKTPAEILEYYYCMFITPNLEKTVLNQMTQEIHDKISDYIESKESATTFGEMPKTSVKGETITSELIYYWMVAFNIPFEAENWHLNRLFSLVRICNIKNSKPKKMSKREAAEERQRLNAERRAKYNTKG